MLCRVSILKIYFSSLAIVLSAAVTAQADKILDISHAAPGTFGRTGGQAVDFSAGTGGAWNPSNPVNGQEYFINSITFTKNNAVNAFENLWIGVYTELSGGNNFNGFLGSSNNSVAWGAGVAGDSFTWTFSNVIAEAGDGQFLYFVFQDSADNTPTMMAIAEGDIGIQRLPDAETLANWGAAIIHGNGTQGVMQGSPNPGRVGLMTLNITAVPEPNTLFVLGTLIGFAVIQRRR